MILRITERKLWRKINTYVSFSETLRQQLAPPPPNMLQDFVENTVKIL